MPDPKHIERRVHSDALEEIIGQPPSWLVKRGIGLFFLIWLILLAGSWFYRYPDVVRTPVVITTENPPVPLVARVDGKIISLRVENGHAVKRRDLLAVMENPASTEDVLQLAVLLSVRDQEERFTAITGKTPHEPALGPVQEPFSRYRKRVSDYLYFLELDLYGRKIASVKEEIKQYGEYVEQVAQQVKFLEDELGLVRKQYVRDSLLFAGELISESAWEQSRARLLEKSREWQEERIELSSTILSMKTKERELLDLELAQREEIALLHRQCMEAEEVLRSAVAEWEQNYLLRSPADGIVSFTRFWSRDQYVAKGETVLTVVPEEPGDIIGRARVGQQRSGKVAPGQQVLIRLDNFPYLEYGHLPGRVRNISRVPDQEAYVVEVSVPQTLETNYAIRLDFSDGMQGTARIITDERPLLIRILAPFKYMYERHIRRRDRLDQNGRSSSSGLSSGGISSSAGPGMSSSGAGSAFSMRKAERLVK
ncbi:MAG TPA: HlyD family efflux transporter periplasmic adaptor subunit [Bacteroidetes bacterium]|nr:HlyD family efflux transporter periplasmic adaptor subunit [Bacteroidota bacterium]